jgi:uncharacterized protein YndB with AHSA1/START domain
MIADQTRQSIVIERTYRATPQELWDLWTTKDGFESWWGPEGFRVEVHALEARDGGELHYDMIADTPEMVRAMEKMGRPASTPTRGWYEDLDPNKRLVLKHVIDFVPGVAPYDSTIVVELVPNGAQTRMVVMLHPMHDAEMTQMQRMGFTSQLTKLDQRFA